MITSITAKRHMETNWRCPLLVGRLSVSVLCRAYCSRCTMARRRSRLALSPTISCATRCPPHQSFDCYCCSHFFGLSWIINPPLPPRLTAWDAPCPKQPGALDSCLPPLLWPTLGFSASSYTNSQVPTVTYRDGGDSWGTSWPLKLVPWLLLSRRFQGFLTSAREIGGLGALRHLDYTPWQHYSPRCTGLTDVLRQRGSVHKKVLYCCCLVSLPSTTDFRPPVRMWGQSGPIPGCH